ncbi:GNAT family N-acetyltransferase [Oculatella sp. LEGE 06141]|uniref:GNAT family N-acetyltransferase n=1 Tax=Oculatella sp. LEGE 06141 TaxID=1828648 RepID=UPI00188244A3|nr:GNAT family N-acetyltransferase [Oculatella sp. LEGE 06141]MBE9178036.1 GNAT family N-acetyltransferase [Oculatella sp. LEGE 06141]
MQSHVDYETLSDAADQRQLAAILSQCFIFDDSETYFNRIGIPNFRLIRQAGQVAGGLAAIPMGQWWNGQSVPMTGIAAVGVAPEQRGSGAAIALLHHLLQELHTNQVPISVLYPATQRLYRKAGYEQGGAYCGWQVSTDSIQMRERSLPVRAVEVSDYTVFERLYQQQARANNGNLDRHPAIWHGLLQTDDKKPLYAYEFGKAGDPEGYIVFKQRHADNGPILEIKDWVALTPAAGRSLWTFLADHRSQVKTVRWCGGHLDALALMLPEQTIKARSIDRWMVRIVNVVQALEKRGYPPYLEMELPLAIQDELLPENNGLVVLSIANGRAKVTRGGSGALKLSIRGLASLYTGSFNAYQLRLAGLLDGTDAALAAATQIFAGAAPWMPDFF